LSGDDTKKEQDDTAYGQVSIVAEIGLVLKVLQSMGPELYIYPCCIDLFNINIALPD